MFKLYKAVLINQPRNLTLVGLVMTHIRYEYTEHWTMNTLNGAMNIVGLITLETYVDIPRSSNYTNSTSPCTRPRMFLLAFLETNPWPTLYPYPLFLEKIKGSRYSTYPGSRWAGKERAWFAHALNLPEILGNRKLLCYIRITATT